MPLTSPIRGTCLVGARQLHPAGTDHGRDIGVQDTLGDQCDGFSGTPDIDLVTLACSPGSGLLRQRRRERETRETPAGDMGPPWRASTSHTDLSRTSPIEDPWTTTERVGIQPGFGRNLNFWAHWIPRLAGQYRVLRRDMRGHGQSADPGPDYVWSVDDLLNDMKGFLDALEIDAVHYIGESVGGILGGR